MRLLLAATMIAAGFAVTLGTASVLRDVHVAWSKSGQGGQSRSHPDWDAGPDHQRPPGFAYFTQGLDLRVG